MTRGGGGGFRSGGVGCGIQLRKIAGRLRETCWKIAKWREIAENCEKLQIAENCENSGTSIPPFPPPGVTQSVPHAHVGLTSAATTCVATLSAPALISTAKPLQHYGRPPWRGFWPKRRIWDGRHATRQKCKIGSQPHGHLCNPFANGSGEALVVAAWGCCVALATRLGQAFA